MSRHVRPLPLLAYCEAEVSPEISEQVEAHLAVCGLCRGRRERVLRGIRLARTLAEVEPQERHIEVPPVADQIPIFKRDDKSASRETCERLLAESLTAALDEPSRAVALVEHAMRIADLLPSQAYDPHWVTDLRAKCWAYLGNARRVLGELWSADEAFRRSEAFLATSTTGNLKVRAEVYDLKASLRRGQRRFGEAVTLLDHAIGIFRELGDLHRVGRSLINKASVLEEQGEFEPAIGFLHEASPLLDPLREPRLIFCSHLNLVALLIAAGRYEEAEEALPELRRVALDQRNPLDLVRVAWAEGRIAFGRGRLGAAEASFREVQKEFFERGMGYDAALASLDLAMLYAQEGCTAELKQLAGELLPVFESREVHREAMAALLMFQHAAEEETLTLELARHLAEFLKRERRRTT